MQDLNELRAIEKDLRVVEAKTLDPHEKNRLTRQISRIEILKGDLKNWITNPTSVGAMVARLRLGGGVTHCGGVKAAFFFGSFVYSRRLLFKPVCVEVTIFDPKVV
jgi:hypothetical protein